MGWGPAPLEQNLFGVLHRSDLETRPVPGLLAVDTLLLEADAQVLGEDLPEWLGQVSSALPAEAEFLTALGRSVDPGRRGLLEENSGLLPGESVASRALVDYLSEMAFLIRTGLLRDVNRPGKTGPPFVRMLLPCSDVPVGR